MTSKLYATTHDGGASWDHQGQTRPTYASGVSPPSDADLAADGWYPEIYPDPATCLSPCCSRSADPTLTDGEAVYQPVNLSDEDCVAAWRSQHQSTLRSQVPTITLTDEAKDSTAKAQAEQWQNKYKSALVFLDSATLAELPDFNTNLSSYDSSEQDYAANLVIQEARNLLVDKELKSSGGTGRYTASEVSAMQSRISFNEGVAQGTQTGVQVPTVGAPRGDAALENETNEKAFFEEVSFDWNGTDYFMPQITLPSIPLGQDPSFVFGMIYNAENVYLSWVPFVQQANGVWKSDIGTDRIPPAVAGSARWRVAVAVNGTQSEFEVTDRVYLVPPQIAESIVRFGGRN